MMTEDEAIFAGYRKGEMERIALATANSELRSEVLRLRTALDAIEEALKAPYPARAAGAIYKIIKGL